MLNRLAIVSYLKNLGLQLGKELEANFPVIGHVPEVTEYFMTRI